MKNKFTKYYCATWLLLLELTFNVWKYIMIHCLNMRGIDHKNIQFRRPDLNLAWKSELSLELEGDVPFTMEFVRDELEKDAKANVAKLDAHRRAIAERAKAAIDDKSSYAAFHKSTFRNDKTPDQMIAEFKDIVADHSELFETTTDVDDRLEEFGGLTMAQVKALTQNLNDIADKYENPLPINEEFLDSRFLTDDPDQTKPSIAVKDELTLARNTKQVKTTTEKQIKRQVDASNKKAKPAKSKKTNIKKVSKSSK